MRMRCPHCKSKAYIRNSAQVTELTRSAVAVCTNWECGHTFAAIISVSHTISPSAIPDPSVMLPISRHARRSLIQHQLNTMPSADYKPTLTPPTTRDLFELDPSPG